MKQVLILSAAGFALACGAASAQDTPYYAKASAGVVWMGDSTNSGRATEDFEVGLIDATLVDGGAYTFNSGFEIGTFLSTALGKSSVFGPFRSEVELLYTRTGLAEHGDFRTLGTDLADVDVSILLGLDTPAGINTGRVLEDAQGTVSTVSLFANFYYDLKTETNAYPYFGIGLGPTWVNVDYSPSGIGFVDDGAVTLGYHASFGFAYDFDERNAINTGWRYVGALSPEVSTDALLASDLEVDVNQFVAEIGWTRRF
ncbi:MAG: P44/Msp2 family outer membrane protein [Pseudomonadota bacterium]